MKTLLLIFCMLCGGMLAAQEYAFKVLVNKGTNGLKAGNEWLPIKVGATLKSADEVRVSPNGYLGLVHSSGKPLEVKEQGQYKVRELSSRIKSGTSVLHKYTDFILSSRNEKQTNLTATGAVIRGTAEIKMYLPKEQQPIVYNDAINVTWSSLPETDSYLVRFNSMFGEELESIESKDTTLSVNLSSKKFANEDNILVQVFSKDDPKRMSEPMVLKKLSKADKNRINASLAEIADQTKEQTALNQLVLAGFYESHLLFIDAATAYQKAISLAPGVPEYQTAYSEFVVRNALKN